MDYDYSEIQESLLDKCKNFTKKNKGKKFIDQSDIDEYERLKNIVDENKEICDLFILLLEKEYDLDEKKSIILMIKSLLRILIEKKQFIF